MGASTFAVGVADFRVDRLAAPVMLVLLRLIRPGARRRYGGAATYVAEHARATTAACHQLHPDHRDARLLPVARGDRPVPRLHRRGNLQGWGWRLPFLVSVVLRLLGLHAPELNESPSSKDKE